MLVKPTAKMAEEKIVVDLHIFYPFFQNYPQTENDKYISVKQP